VPDELRARDAFDDVCGGKASLSRPDRGGKGFNAPQQVNLPQLGKLSFNVDRESLSRIRVSFSSLIRFRFFEAYFEHILTFKSKSL